MMDKLDALLISNEKMGLGFADPGTVYAEVLIRLYNYVSVFLVLIFMLVVYLFMVVLLLGDFVIMTKWRYYNEADLKFLKIADISEYRALENSWAVVPGFILVLIAIPSFSVEYWLDPITETYVTVSVTGHQWYWAYDCLCTDIDYTQLYKLMSYDNMERWGPSGMYSRVSSMVHATDMEYRIESVLDMNDIQNAKGFRLFSVKPLVLPVGVPIRILVTSADVLHSWAIPALGMKVDAVPGRLSSFVLTLASPGDFFGQCSELCGMAHGFMPIRIHAVSADSYHHFVWYISGGTFSMKP